MGAEVLGSLAFNLIVNGMLSFGFTLAWVWLAVRLLRVGPQQGEHLLLLLPWLKLGWDAARGIPANSFFWQRLDGVRQDMGEFQLGLGVNHWGPLLEFRLGARVGGVSFPQSAADLFSSRLSALWPQLPALLSAAVFSVSCVLVLRRLAGWLAHAREERRARTSVLSVQHGSRNVVVVIDAAHDGAPYATGVLEPRIVFAAEHYGSLSAAERDACLKHELSHVAHGDTLWYPLLTLLADVFWFLPGSRWLQERSRAVMELRADAAAVTRGASPIALASALVCTGEWLARPARGVGLSRQRLLIQRVRSLLDPETRVGPRFGLRHVGVRRVAFAVLALGVLQSVFFGN